MTIDRKIVWKMYYEQQDSPQHMREMSQPDGFVAQDEEHGFGVITLRMYDDMEELHGEPKLYIQGDRMTVDEQEVLILLDAIQVQIDDRRRGEGMTEEERFERRVEQEVRPYQRRNENLREALAEEEAEKEQLLSIVENLVSSENRTGSEREGLQVEAFVDALEEYHNSSEQLPSSVDMKAVQEITQSDLESETIETP